MGKPNHSGAKRRIADGGSPRGRAGGGADAPTASAIPDEMSSSQAKDQISDLVKKAAAGGRTTILSRGYAIAIIGPLGDIPAGAQGELVRLPTTEIKSGQTSLKGIIARDDLTVLTTHGHDRAVVYRPRARRHPAQTEDKLDRLIDLLEESRLVERQNERALDESVRLQRLTAALHAEIGSLLELMEKAEPRRAAVWRDRYAAIKKAREAVRS